MAALCIVVPPASAQQHHPRNCSCRLCLKSQEGDAQQMLVGTLPATQAPGDPPTCPRARVTARTTSDVCCATLGSSNAFI